MAAAAAAGGRQSHRAGWLEQNLDVLAVSDAFSRFQAILTFLSIFSRFGMFLIVFGGFWSVSDFGLAPRNNPRRQVFLETGIGNRDYIPMTITSIVMTSSTLRITKLYWGGAGQGGLAQPALA